MKIIYYLYADTEIQICGVLQLWFYHRNYLKVSQSHSDCVLKKEPGFGQRRMFIRIESKIHVIISVFLGAMVVLPAVSYVRSSLCSWKMGVSGGVGLWWGFCGRIKIEFVDLSTSQNFLQQLKMTYDHDYYVNFYDTLGQQFEISFSLFLERET